MTIAACYLSPEGVVLGADSTSTILIGSNHQVHHFIYGQKIFEVGSGSNLGLATWGLGSLGSTSFRTLIAQLGDDLSENRPGSVRFVADRWTRLFSEAFDREYGGLREEALALAAKATRTAEEDATLTNVRFNLAGGFCIGGHVCPGRTPEAYEITYDLLSSPTIAAIQMGLPRFWGVPNLISRVLFGADPAFLDALVGSGKWTGTPEEMITILGRYMLQQPPVLPIREAVDWVYSSVYTTIKAMKFSEMAPVCGGPIEVALITTDRPFRWVSHKGLDAAIDAVPRG